MQKQNSEDLEQEKTQAQTEVMEEQREDGSEPANQADNQASADVPSELDQAKADLAEAKDKYLRLYSEFENFRRRTAKERLELIGTANKELMADLVPVLDDFERAAKALAEKSDVEAAKEGIDLIYQKLKKTLESKGLKRMEVAKGADFDGDLHEAITQIPTGDELAGKVVDVVENGYFLNEKVVRFAKVVTGAKA